MMGKQHKIGTAGTSTLVSVALWRLCHYSPYVFSIIPIAVYFSTFPDIDQLMTTPKEWKIVKKILIIMIVAIGLISIAALLYSIYKWYVEEEDKYKWLVLNSAAVVVGYIAIFIYSNSKDGSFIFKHRGFTHTLVIPILLYMAFMQIKRDSFNNLIDVLMEIGSMILLGMLTGITSHIFEDLLCKAGCPILWPLSPSMIHIGNAITGDKRIRGKAHISSLLYTYGLVVVCILLICYIMYFTWEVK